MLAAIGALIFVLCPQSNATTCVIVNINGSINGGASSCQQDESKRVKSYSVTETWSDACKGKVNKEDECSKDLKNTTEKECRSQANPLLLNDSNVRNTLCVFISGFSLAAGLILVGMVGVKGRRSGEIQLPPPLSFRTSSTSPTASSSGYPSDRADYGSTIENQPYRARAAELRRREHCVPRVGTSLGAASSSPLGEEHVFLNTDEYWC